jgi:uncharacterized hydrophobic protein (TIGR00271 family)
MQHDINELRKNEQSKLENNLITVVNSQLELGVSYLLLLISSSIIATLGLIIDSTAVVIGAMIISPLFWAVLGITIGLITTKQHLIQKATKIFLLSVLIVLCVGAVITFLTPITSLTTEIKARANPTFIDLLIALSTSFIGVAAIYYPGISSSKTGVAISISMLPPLCVSAIGLAMGSIDIFIRSFILFLANVAAIIFAGIITLYILKVRPRLKDEKKRLKLGFLMSCVFIIVLSLPLIYYLNQAISESKITTVIETDLAPMILSDSGTTYSHQHVRIKSININEPTFLTKENYKVHVFIEIPRDLAVTKNLPNFLEEKIQQKTNKPIDVTINLVQYTSL